MPAHVLCQISLAGFLECRLTRIGDQAAEEVGGIRAAGVVGRRGPYPRAVGGARRRKFRRAIYRKTLRVKPGVIFGVGEVCEDEDLELAAQSALDRRRRADDSRMG